MDRCAWQFNFIQEISVIKNVDNLPLDVGVISEVLVEGSVVLEGHFEVRRRFYKSKKWEQTLGHVWRRPLEEVKRKTKVKEALSEKKFLLGTYDSKNHETSLTGFDCFSNIEKMCSLLLGEF